MIIKLGIDQVGINLLLAHIALLRHLGQRACQVDDGVAAVVFREQEDGEVLAVFLWVLMGAVWLRGGLRGRVGGRVGA